MSNEFQSVSHRNQREMLDAIAGEWITAGGLNNATQVRETLAEMSDDAMAAEAIEGWGLDQGGQIDPTPSHMEEEDYTTADLAAAFARLRTRLTEFLSETYGENYFEIAFELSEHDDGYNVGDWFKGGWATVEEASKAETPEIAEIVLQAAYKGPDVDGVEVKWQIA